MNLSKSLFETNTKICRFLLSVNITDTAAYLCLYLTSQYRLQYSIRHGIIFNETELADSFLEQLYKSYFDSVKTFIVYIVPINV